MLRFEIELKIAGQTEGFRVEELDPWPDPDGYVRYFLQNEDRNSVISIDKSYWDKPFIMTEEDAWDYLEKILYPESGRVFSEDTVFSHEELELIRLQIGRYVMAIKS